MIRERIYADPPLARPDQIRLQGYVERETPDEIVIRAQVPSRAGFDELSFWRRLPFSREGYWENWRTVERPR